MVALQDIDLIKVNKIFNATENIDHMKIIYTKHQMHTYLTLTPIANMNKI